MTEEKQNKKEKYLIGEVVTGTAQSIIDGENPISDQQAIVKILNLLEEINKKL